MMEAYSPHRDGESPLHSPHRLRYYDHHPALEEIRRSLSRSPSKNSFRAMSPAVGATQYQPSPLSPSRRSTSDFILQGSTMTSPFASRNTPGPRLSRPGMRRTAQTTGALRTRTSPKSPSKRILTDSSDSGNATPVPLRKRSSTEADREQCLRGSDNENDKENSSSQEDNLGYRTYTRQDKRRSGGSLMSFMSPRSPMKRPEPSMLDSHTDIQSPSAKRRSMHGAGMDFSIFESDSLSNSINQNCSQDDNDWLRTGSPAPTSRFSTIPKRSSSLRRSTVQQRQGERPSNLKYNQFLDIEPAWAEATPKTGKGLRMSLDNHIDPLPRDSPFSAQGHLLSASIHPTNSVHQIQNQDVQSQQSRHPLSRTMTQSSSSSFQDESPTHEPVHRPTRPRSYDFSKSMPVGTARPSPAEESSQQSSQGTFATPSNYKSARPLPAAFMSTGLISKKNRNAEDANAGLPKAHMPDTPCKKQTILFPAENKFKKSVIGRSARESFAVPPSPLEPLGAFSKSSAFPFARSGGIFGVRANRPSLMRKASLASIDSEDKSSQSPSRAVESQSTDSDYPPTPTKHMEALERKASTSPSPHHSRTLSAPRFTASIQGNHLVTSKLSPVQASPDSVDGDSDSVMEDSPSASLRPKPMRKVTVLQGTSFTQGRVLRNLCSPTPLSRKAVALPALESPAMERAKSSAFAPVTPQAEKGGSPHTPLDGFFPPDPSGLTISGRGDRPTTRHGTPAVIPATPTGPREYFPNFSNRPSLNLTADGNDVDSSLTSRFEKVDLVGTGEFSQVYRVSVPPEASPFRKIYALSTPRGLSRSSTGITDERVFAVKKSRYPYSGPRDRQRKIQEVDILKALRHADHVVAFVDSWEHDSHLYIQTEFCEEGTLDVFLAQAGLKARLDDFRIWKILLELAQGLKHIHESGFIHLDMKPANVLITFDGVLKIADFGMATKWPAKAGIEGEGDREYIGPEVLMGKYDRPADIFALGLIMLEIAGNVELPDNGASWQKLRSGDMSDVPSLTWSSGVSTVLRDPSGNPLSEEAETATGDDHAMDGTDDDQGKRTHNGELLDPPLFMTDAMNPQALDSLVKWMIAPGPDDRPLASDVLLTEGVQFIEARRRAGATVYEGNWGPADEVLAEDAEMIDV